MKLKAMRKIIYTLILLNFLYPNVSQAYISGDSITVVKQAKKHSKETLLINSLLGQHHYRKIGLNDSLSAVIFENYLLALDNNMAYFMDSDIQYFNKYKYQLDDDIRRGNADVAFQIYRIFRDRVNKRIDYIFELIARAETHERLAYQPRAYSRDGIGARC